MRAKIIQYNSTEGKGIAMADGQQYDFTIRQWRSEVAPSVGQSIDITLDDGHIACIFIVRPEELIKEKLGGVNKGLPTFDPKAIDINALNKWLEVLGIPVIAAYLIFIISTTLFEAIGIKVMGAPVIGLTLWNIGQGLSSVSGSSGGIGFLLIVAYLSFLIPLFWNDRRAWFALFLPILPLLKTGFDIFTAISTLKKTMAAAMGNMGDMSGIGQTISKTYSDMFTYGFGLYVAVASAMLLAFFALQRSGVFGSLAVTTSSTPVTTSDAGTSPVHVVPTSSVCRGCSETLEPEDIYCGNCGCKAQ